MWKRKILIFYLKIRLFIIDLPFNILYFKEKLFYLISYPYYKTQSKFLEFIFWIFDRPRERSVERQKADINNEDIDSTNEDIDSTNDSPKALMIIPKKIEENNKEVELGTKIILPQDRRCRSPIKSINIGREAVYRDLKIISR